MQVQIKYEFINDIVEFLYNLTLKGKQSRHRSRLVKTLQEKWKQIGEEEMELLKEFAGVDEEENPKTKDDGKSFDIDDIKGFTQQRKELFDEHFILEGGEASGYLRTVKEFLFSYDETVSGKTAEIYDYLCEAFENGNQEEEQE
ncbi:DUF1617 family protein [Niallia taxi]|uniref:DUF1617 family protein n=1 Tax=Niallia taxi TaxID=2499688 RepID=UPI003F60A029